MRVNDNFINSCHKEIYLINTARGKCVNTSALVCGLKNGQIKGACLDVLEYEDKTFENLNQKIKNDDMKYLINSNKVILSPHVAGWTKESNIKIAKILFEKIMTDFSQ